MGFIKNGLNSVKGTNPSRKIFTRVFVILVFAGICAGAWYFFSNKGEADNDKRAGSKNRPVSVVVAEIKKGDITVSLNALGTVVPRNIVTVYPQVSGVLTNVYFKEGEMVQAGQVLAQIDPRSYEATLKQAQGALERDKMLLRNAEIDLKRYETLIAQESVSNQVFDTQRALVEQYRGNLLTDQGLVDSARLQVEFARITSPISGRIGLRQVDPGNLVQANNSTPLFVITQVSPTTVIFAVPQSLLSTYLQKINPLPSLQSDSREGARGEGNQGERVSAKNGATPLAGVNSGPYRSGKNAANGKPSGASKPVEIEAWDSDNKSILDKGRLESIDNVIDLTTGTVKLRAIFANAKGALFANQFVNVKSILEVKKDVIYMPATALQKGSIGTFVYRVNEDGKTVSVVPVKLGPTDEDKILVESGLSPGDKVVVDGLDKLREGANIIIGEAARPGGAKGKRSGDPADKTGNKGDDKNTTPSPNTPGAAAVQAKTEGAERTNSNANANANANEGTSNDPVSKLQKSGSPDKSEQWDKSKASKAAP